MSEPQEQDPTSLLPEKDSYNSKNSAASEVLADAALVSVELNQAVESVGDLELEAARKNRLDQAREWIKTQETDVPVAIAAEVALIAQERMQILNEGVIDDEYFELNDVRDRAINRAEELDFRLIEVSGGDWTLRANLNAMHEKFRHVSAKEISNFLGKVEDSNYEITALRISDIIADHAPALLTENLKAIVDPSRPLWRACSAHASILLRGSERANIKDMHVYEVATALPVSDRVEYKPEDDMALKSITDMGDDELALYCVPERISTVIQKGYASFEELTFPAREACLTRRLFEVVGESSDEDTKKLADQRNRELENEPILRQGDFVHATRSPEILNSILSNGLRCGEAIMGNDRSTIKYPFTVSFLEVNENIAKADSVAERLELLKNKGYGSINMVLNRDENSIDATEGQHIGVINQRQIFGGVPATEIKSIVIREETASEKTVEKVIQSIVEHKMFIPVYSGSTGEALLDAQQFDSLVAAKVE